MRTNLLTAFLVAATVTSYAVVASADAADSLAGRYDVAFEAVTSNCQGTGLTLDKSTMVISKKAPGVAVELPKVATMAGKATKAGRLKAASPVGKTSLPSLEGKFSIAGTVGDDGKLDAVFVAEFYADGKPVCTQSWSATGARAAAGAPKATATPAAPPARFALLPPME